MFETFINCNSYYKNEDSQILTRIDYEDYSNCTVLLLINALPNKVSEVRIPIHLILDRELEMRKRGSVGYSSLMQRFQDWKMRQIIPHIARCGMFNEILVEVDLDFASISKSFVPDRPIEVLRRFYETGVLKISNDLSGDEILYLKSAIDKLNIWVDDKCMRYDSFSSNLSWSIWSTYLMLRDSIAQWISNQVSTVQHTKHSQSIVAFLTSAEDKNVRYFVGDHECMVIDAVPDRHDIDLSACKRVIHNCLSEDHLDNCAKDNSNSYSHFIRENLVQLLKTTLSNVKSMGFVFEKSITMYTTEHPVSFKQVSRPVLLIELKPSDFSRPSSSSGFGTKCASIDQMNSEWLLDVLTGF